MNNSDILIFFSYWFMMNTVFNTLEFWNTWTVSFFGQPWLTVPWYLVAEALTYTHTKYNTELNSWGYSWSNFLVQCASSMEISGSKMEVSMKLSHVDDTCSGDKHHGSDDLYIKIYCFHHNLESNKSLP